MPLLVKGKTKTKPNPPKKPQKPQPLFSYLRLHSCPSTLKSVMFSDTLHAATKCPDMVLPVVPSRSVGLVPWAFQICSLCLQALPCPELSPKV